jgi:DNA-binding XRE family transcriptional regulator
MREADSGQGGANKNDPIDWTASYGTRGVREVVGLDIGEVESEAFWLELIPDPLDIFAANRRRIRQERNLSQERLAHCSDLNMTHVAKIERSEREPGVRTISKLARALEVSASELFDGIDRRPAREPPDRL